MKEAFTIATKIQIFNSMCLILLLNMLKIKFILFHIIFFLVILSRKIKAFISILSVENPFFANDKFLWIN